MSRLQKKLVQFFESCWEAGFNFHELCEEKDSILWVMLKRRVQFFELYFLFLKKLWITFKKGFNYLTNFPKKSTLSKKLILKVILKKFYWKNVQFFESYFDEGSILSVILKKRFNSVSHIQKKVQFCESNSKKFNSASRIQKKFNSVSHIFQKRFNLLSDIQEGFNTFNSLKVFSKKKSNSLRHI